LKFEQVQTIGILGGGVMGGGIAQTAATFGYRAIVVEISDELCDASRETIVNGRYGLQRGLERGKLTQQQFESALANLEFTTDPRRLAEVELLIEAVPEILELKQRIFAEMDGIVRPDAIFASNTSGYVIAEVGRDLRPARRPLFLGMHWFSPAPVMKGVEIIVTPATSEETYATVVAVTERMGHETIRLNDAPGRYGFIANRIWGQAYEEATRIFEEGIATKQDIDRAMKLGYGWPAGPFEGVEGFSRGWQ
jgi:3-hydroxybutyryl-CoA dehydrogenase